MIHRKSLYKNRNINPTNGINLSIVADNLRKGAALNAVQIAEILIRDYL